MGMGYLSVNLQKIPTSSSCVATGSTLEPVGRSYREEVDVSSIKNFLMVRATRKWNGIVVSLPLLEVSKYMPSSGLSGKLYDRSRHQRDT